MSLWSCCHKHCRHKCPHMVLWTTVAGCTGGFHFAHLQQHHTEASRLHMCSRAQVRAKYMALEPVQNRYVAHLRSIRAIQEYLVRRAERHAIPAVDNTNVDRSVAAIHATAFGCLRRLARVRPHRLQSCPAEWRARQIRLRSQVPSDSAGPQPSSALLLCNPCAGRIECSHAACVRECGG